MANESLALSYAPVRRVLPGVIAEIVFVGLLLVMFVGLSPFSPPAPTAAAAIAAPGDALRQILFLSLFFLILIAAAFQLGWNALRAVPVPLLAMLAWCLLSAWWSDVPEVSFRRAALAALVVITTMLSTEMVGAPRAFYLWRVVLAVILAVNWLSIPLIQTAVHLPGEVDPSLIGDWRGLYAEKNAAGAVCVLTALLFLFSRNGRNNWIGWLVAAAATGFLIMTRSKTSLGLYPVVLLAGLAYRLSWRDGLGRAIFLCGATLILALAASATLLDWSMIAQQFNDPAGFTGRAEIWLSSLGYIRDHPLLGAGFGTIAPTGALSPLHFYARDHWVETIPNSHNGYLQILVTTGGIGLLLALWSLAADALARFWRLDPGGFKALLFALFVFVLLHNFMESDFLQSDSPLWFAFLVMLASLRDNSLTLRS
jgi:exopolysaccharide production protein ExoQ